MPSNLSDRRVSPLRARMIEDMTVRGFTEKTRQDYVRHVQAFAAFIGRSPATATPDDIRGFQLHQRQSGMQPPSINTAVSALRFLFTVTLDRPDLARRLTVVRQPRRLPSVLSVEEVALLLQAAPGPKYRAAFATAYGAGLRVSEVVALKVGDIDSERMLLRIEQGKGRKDRHAMLSPQLLERLLPLRQLLDDRQDPVGHGNAAATTALGDFDLDAFRLGTLDHQQWHRDLHEVAHTEGTQLRPTKPGPAGHQQDVGESLVQRRGRLPERLEFLLAEWVHLDRRFSDGGDASADHRVRGDDPLADRPCEEGRQGGAEPSHR